VKITRIILKNLASFKQKVDIDFNVSPLKNSPLFAITGPTGAGKTTILDAISLALFNKTPRLESNNEKNSGQIIRQGEKEGYAEVHLRSDERLYIAKWRGRRKKDGSFIRENFLYDGSTRELIAEKKEFGAQVEKAIGLDYHSFKLAVILAQGEFALFLKSDKKDKSQVIEQATGFDIFKRLKDVLSEKLKEVRFEFELCDRALSASPSSSPESIKLLEKKLESLQGSLNAKKEEKSKLDMAKSEEEIRVDTHTRLINAQEKYKILQKQADSFRLLEETISLAKLAESINPLRKEVDKEKEKLANLAAKQKESYVRLITAQKEHFEAKRVLEESQESFEDNEEKSKELFSLFAKARDEETLAAVKLTDAEEHLREKEASGLKIQDIKKAFASISDELNKEDAAIQGANDIISKNPVTDNIDDDFNESVRIFEKISNTRLRTSEKEKNCSKYEEKFKNAESENIKIGKNITKLGKNIAQKQDFLDSSEKKLQDVNEKELDTRIKSALVMRGNAKNFLELTSNENKQNLNLQKKKEDFGILQAALNKLEKAMPLCEANYELSSKSFKIASKTREIAALHNEINGLRKLLHKGEECPVCGSPEHPFAGTEEPEKKEALNVADAKLTEADEQLKKYSTEKISMEKELDKLQNEEALLKTVISELSENLLKTRSDIDGISKEWFEVYGDIAISLKWLDCEIESMELVWKKTQALRKAVNELKTNKADSGKRLLGFQKDYEHNEKIINELQGSLNEQKIELFGLHEKLKDMAEEFHSHMPHDIKKKTPEAAMEVFKNRVKNIRFAKGRLEETKNKITPLKEKQSALSSNLKNCFKKHEEHSEKAALLTQEAEELLLLAKKKTGGVTSTEAESRLQLDIADMRKRLDENRRDKEDKNTELARCETNAEKLKRECAEQDECFLTLESEYETELTNNSFSTTSEHKEALREAKWLSVNEQKVQVYKQDVHSAEREREECSTKFNEEGFDKGYLPLLNEQILKIDGELSHISQEIGENVSKIKEGKKNIEHRQGLETAYNNAKSEKERWDALKTVMPRGNELRDFALEDMLDILLAYANKQLEDMTERYSLTSESGLRISLVDRWSGGERRPVETLSGGESFLTSLSLALALSELSAGRTKLESLFLDEGFGTLDSDTLEITMCALEKLRMSGRTIGVISHIGELTRRVPVRIEVVKLGSGESKVEVVQT